MMIHTWKTSKSICRETVIIQSVNGESFSVAQAFTPGTGNRPTMFAEAPLGAAEAMMKGSPVNGADDGGRREFRTQA